MFCCLKDIAAKLHFHSKTPGSGKKQEPPLEWADNREPVNCHIASWQSDLEFIDRFHVKKIQSQMMYILLLECIFIS